MRILYNRLYRKWIIVIISQLIINVSYGQLSEKLIELKEFDQDSVVFHGDWLIHPVNQVSGLYQKDNQLLVLSNGLISRTFTIFPDAATIGMDLLTENTPFLRAVKPEAVIEINGTSIKVGGLEGQPVMNYFKEGWLNQLHKDSLAMHLQDFNIKKMKKRFPWKKRLQWMPEDLPWPPGGLELILKFSFEKNQKDLLNQNFGKEITQRILELIVEVHYAIYDGIPLISKWISVMNPGEQPVILDSFQSEIFAFIEPVSSVGDLSNWPLPNMTIDTDYAFGGGMGKESSLNKSYFWRADPEYSTIINYNRIQPSMLLVQPSVGPSITINPGDRFDSYRVFELLHDSYDRERKGLQIRKMYRTIAPWITENPILMHVRQADDESVKLAIDQCAEVGFEMVIMTFGSGFDLEDSTRENIQRMKELADYAHEKGIALGGYSLLASRSIDEENDVIMPEGQKPRFNQSPCLQSSWGRNYFRNLYRFYELTGMDILEHDGSYPGDICYSENHPGHKGMEDSQWQQFGLIADFYKWCRENGIYLNVPDWYFLNGSNKIAMGYRETNWSLPRDFQEIIERQNVYDGTWEKTPSMGWMFVPLVQYHGGGEAATIEPLRDHLDHYEQRLANLFGAGVQACYRGPRLYDTPQTRDIVKKWVDFYKKHRKILDGDIIHIRRPDGKDYDGILHTDPAGEEKGLIMLYNPLNSPVNKTISIDIYYTGLKGNILLSHEDNIFLSKELRSENLLDLDVNIPPGGWTWYVVK